MVNAVVPVVRAIPGFCQPICSLTHLLGASAALIAAVPLIRLVRGCPVRARSVRVYAACVIANLTISGIYHAVAWDRPARAILQRFDHFAIWLLIAGTFTAVHGVMCRGFWRRGVLTMVWVYAASGVMLQVLWFRVFSSRPGMALYLGFGWLGLVSVFKLGREIGFRAVRPIWYAGIAITAGALFETFGRHLIVNDWIGSHEIFHLSVVIGVAVHWRFVRQLLMRHRQPITAG